MTPPPAPHRGRRAVATLGAWLLVAIIGWGVAWVVAPDANAGGQCEGLGFGCTLTPKDVLAFAAFLATPLAVGTLLIALFLVVVAVQRSWLPRLGGIALGTLAGACGLALTLGIAAGLVVVL
ncbi:hypothetical protein [Janibacter anophelis]|uniref:hypothetical protein n=1 Tax=Janibacter anophelis TaxID=319054 RepID=UPI0008313D5B|nr:hypothetical protein [Janibacter anophelis]